MPDLIDCFWDFRLVNSAYGRNPADWPGTGGFPALLSLMAGTNWGRAGLCRHVHRQNWRGKFRGARYLIIAARSGQQNTRFSAINALGELGPKAIVALPVLTQNLSDSDSLIRVSSALAAWQIKGKTNAPVAFMAKELENELDHGSPPSTVPNNLGPHEFILLEIVGALHVIGSQAHPVVPLLRQLRNDTNVWLRRTAAEALWTINRETNELVPICLETLRYVDPGAPVIEAELLDQFCVEQHVALPELNEMLGSRDTRVQLHAAHALWTVTGETDKTVPALVRCLQDHFRCARRRESSPRRQNAGPDGCKSAFCGACPGGRAAR